MRRPRIKEKVRVIGTSIPALYGKEVIVSDVNWVEVTVYIPNTRNRHYTLLDEEIEYIEPEKVSKEERHKIFKTLIKPDMIVNKHAFANELKFFYILMKRYPNIEFWRTLKMTYQVHSIAWFFSPEGKSELVKLYNQFNLDFQPKRIDIGTTKIGADSTAPKAKPKLRDWLL